MNQAERLPVARAKEAIRAPVEKVGWRRWRRICRRATEAHRIAGCWRRPCLIPAGIVDGEPLQCLIPAGIVDGWRVKRPRPAGIVGHRRLVHRGIF
jgi:hypothetical protein